MFEEEAIFPFDTNKHYGSADISDIEKLDRGEDSQNRKIFEEELILPCYIREKCDEKVDVGRESFFKGMSDVEIREEIQVLSNCSKNDFYFLLKNEPQKYCSIVEQSPECGVLASDRFQFSISRVDDTTSKVSLSVKDEHPIILLSTDSELYNDLQQYINAKFKETVFNLEHDKGSRPKALRQKRGRGRGTAVPLNPLAVGDSKDTLGGHCSDIISQKIEQIQTLLSELKQLVEKRETGQLSP